MKCQVARSLFWIGVSSEKICVNTVNTTYSTDSANVSFGAHKMVIFSLFLGSIRGMMDSWI